MHRKRSRAAAVLMEALEMRELMSVTAKLPELAQAGVGLPPIIVSPGPLTAPVAPVTMIYAPAGLDIGADTPEAIGLSIAAEIQTVLKAREGGHLRNRKGSIYDRK